MIIRFSIAQFSGQQVTGDAQDLKVCRPWAQCFQPAALCPEHTDDIQQAGCSACILDSQSFGFTVVLFPL